MCRMILAQGRFDPADILQAASAMARGACAAGPAPTPNHPNGFGLLWRDPDSKSGFQVLHALDDLGRADLGAVFERAGPSLRQSDFLAVHARHATLPENRGADFCHPLRDETEGVSWFFMHNGYLPTIHRHLDLEASRFDSAEYFAVLKRVYAGGFEAERLSALLEGLPQPHGAANFFALRDRGGLGL